MTYYDMLGISPTNDLEQIVMTVMKLKSLKLPCNDPTRPGASELD